MGLWEFLFGSSQVEEPGQREAPSYWWADSSQPGRSEVDTPDSFFDGIF